MKISIYSCINSLIFSAVIFAFVFLKRRRYQYSHIFEVYIFLLLYTLGILRLTLPLDFYFTKGLPIRGAFSDIYKLLFISKIKVQHCSISFGSIVLFVISTISFYKCSKFIVLYNRTIRRWRTNSITDMDKINKINMWLEKRYIKIPKCKVASSPDISIPVVTGIFKKKVILPDFDYTLEELYYMFLHEYTHIYHNDFPKKFLLELLFCFFWWIPLSDFIKKDLEHTFEIRCDNTIFRICSYYEQSRYMDVLVKSLKKAHSDSNDKLDATMQFIIKDRPNEIIERFNIMTNKKKFHINGSFFLTVIITLCIFIVSYIRVPFPSFEVPEEIKFSEHILSPETSYIKKADNMYYIITEPGLCIEIPEHHAQNLIESGVPVL